MNRPLRTLMVEHSEEEANLWVEELRLGGYEPDIDFVATSADLAKMTAERGWDVIIAEHSLLAVASEAQALVFRRSGFRIPMVAVSALRGEKAAIEAMKAGAVNLVRKDEPSQLVPAVEFALQKSEEARAAGRADTADSGTEDIPKIVLRNSGDPTFAFDDRFRYIYWNPAMGIALGIEEEQALGKRASELLPSLKETREEKYFAEAISGKSILAMDRRYVLPNGAERFFEIQYSPLFVEGGEIIGGVGVARDISRRKRSERELHTLSKLAIELSGANTIDKLGAILLSYIEGIWSWDACILSFRRTGKVWFESVIAVDTVNGEKRSFPNDLYEVRKEGLIHPVILGEPVLMNRGVGKELPGLTAFGDENRLSASIMYVPVRVQGEVVGIFSVQSYTPHHYTEYDLEVLQRVADAVGPALKRCEAEGYSKSFSSLGQRLAGATTPEEAARVVMAVASEMLLWDACSLDLYSSRHNLVHNILAVDLIEGRRVEFPGMIDDAPPSGMTWKTITEGAQLVLRDEAPVADNGEFRPFGDTSRRSASLMFVPVRSHSGVIGVLTLQSYNPHFYSEEDLKVLEALADHCSGALERTQAQEDLKLYAIKLQQSNRELQEFAYVASHDLQEPLNKIRAFGDRLQSVAGDLLSDHARDYLQRMQNAATRMQTLITDLLTLTRVASASRPFVPVDLGNVAREVVSDLEVRIEKTGGRVEIENLPVIKADPTQMRQLLQNLIGNALKFHHPEKPPLVKVYCVRFKERRSSRSSPMGEICQILVHDNGIGFEEKDADRIFGVFQRLHGRGEYEGSGIGLAVCRKIAERHGGSITAKSKSGEGSTFVVTLPIEHEEADV